MPGALAEVCLLRCQGELFSGMCRAKGVQPTTKPPGQGPGAPVYRRSLVLENPSVRQEPPAGEATCTAGTGCWRSCRIWRHSADTAAREAAPGGPAGFCWPLQDLGTGEAVCTKGICQSNMLEQGSRNLFFLPCLSNSFPLNNLKHR